VIRFRLARTEQEPLTVLCLGAHSDDIEIGCGATLLQLLTAYPRTCVHWVVFSGSEARAAETRHSASLFLRGAASTVETHAFRDGFFPYDGAAIKDVYEALKERLTPDLVFTHDGRDRHQDHRVVSELTWNTFRDHTILEYEIPKYDGGLSTPNVFVPVDEQVRRQKIEYLMTAFGTQRDKRWFNDATFDGLMRLRGVESASPTGYAEGFHGRKLTIL
jgi:LmbE family N-acetylglucosaminyl deacetylase